MELEHTPILEGAVDCVQPAAGYRFSVDSLLLPQFVLTRQRERRPGRLRVLELGGGCGVVSAILLASGLAERAITVELQPGLHQAAEETARQLPASERLLCLNRDFRTLLQSELPFSPELIVSNPPYYPLEDGRKSADGAVCGAKHELHSTMSELLETLRRLLQGRALACLSYPAWRMGELLALLPKFRLRAHALQLAWTKEDGPANRFFVELGRGEQRLSILPPLFVHRPDGSYGAWYDELLAAVKTPT